MVKKKITQTLSDIKPYLEKIAIDTGKGYIFGCLFSAFVPSKESLGNSMHRNGKNFAKMSAIYSATELALLKIGKLDNQYNSIIAGGIAGATGSKYGYIKGGMIFGGYSGLAHYFNKKQKKK